MKIYLFDLETIEWATFYCGGIMDYETEEMECFLSTKDMVDYILSHKGIYYAHNGGKYDVVFLLSELMKKENWIMRYNAGCIMEMHTKDKTISIRDSLLILKSSIVKWGKMLGLPKGEIDYEKIKEYPIQVIYDYMKRDCLVLKKAIEVFLDIHPWGDKIPTTIASAAMRIFKDEFIGKRIYTSSDNDSKYWRASYFGGRCEIFKFSSGPINCYDFNSLYPSVCMDESMPWYRCKETNRLSGLYAIDGDFFIPESCYIPPLPYRYEAKLLFPAGYISGIFWKPEIERLLESGGKILKIKKCYEWETRYIGDYFKFFYKKRKETPNGSPKNYMYKFLLNSLTGKFGEKREREQLVGEPETITNETQWFPEFGLWTKPVDSWADYHLPWVVAYICSKARARLHEVLSKTDCYYCDTDSIYCTDTLPTSEKIGDLKLEDSILSARFVLPKLYEYTKLNGEIVGKHKGFTMQQSLDDILKNGERINRGIFTLGRMKQSKLSVPMRKLLDKRVVGTYNKRRIVGNDTEPWIIGKDGKIYG